MSWRLADIPIKLPNGRLDLGALTSINQFLLTTCNCAELQPTRSNMIPAPVKIIAATLAAAALIGASFKVGMMMPGREVSPTAS